MTTTDVEDSMRRKAQNEEYSMAMSEEVAGVKFSAEFEGNELASEQLWLQVRNAVMEFSGQYESADDILRQRFGDETTASHE